MTPTDPDVFINMEIQSDVTNRDAWKTQYCHDSVRTANIVLIGERSHNTYQNRNFPDSLFMEREREREQNSNINN